MNSITEFFNMGGYALYVWGSFGATALLMVLEPILVRKRRADILKRLDRMARVKAGRSE